MLTRNLWIETGLCNGAMGEVKDVIYKDNDVPPDLPGIMCDICNRWSHTKCNNLTPTDFNSLKNSEETWFCTTCIMSIFPFNSKTNFNITNNKNISSIKNFFSELNSTNKSSDGDDENVAGSIVNTMTVKNLLNNFQILNVFQLFILIYHL